MSINEEDVKTYGIGQNPTDRDPTTGGGLTMIPEQNSASAATAPPQTKPRTPAGQTASGALAVEDEPPAEEGRQYQRNLAEKGGTPTEVIENMPSDQVVSVSEQVLKDIKSKRKGANPELLIGRGKEANELLGAQGATVDKAFKQMDGLVTRSINIDEAAERIDGKEAKRRRFAWKNVYEKIAPEEMGLFLIDFGLRAMMAGESMGDLGALGAAGSGALGALQGRRELAETKAVEDYQWAVGAGQKERELDIKAAGNAPKLTATEDDMVYWDGKEWVKTGLKPPLTGNNRPFAKELDMKALEASGYFDEETMARIRANVPLSDELLDKAGDRWNNTVAREGYPKGLVKEADRKTSWGTLSAEQQEAIRQEWVMNQVRNYFKANEQLREERAAQRALQATS